MGRLGVHVLEVAQLAKERPSRDDRKTSPKTPDDATEYRDDFMAEELPRISWALGTRTSSRRVAHRREGYDKKYGYRY